MHLEYLDIISDKPFTVPMPWIALADAAARYQTGGQADERACFGPDWFDENGEWEGCHHWHEPAEVLRRLALVGSVERD